VILELFEDILGLVITFEGKFLQIEPTMREISYIFSIMMRLSEYHSFEIRTALKNFSFI
jgi:hypothetical protein